ncbi:MAG: type II secretion system GspH family protein [Marinobacterium sp.]|nr:type II secretion system GspH family protein [Marinobacterium sp.]
MKYVRGLVGSSRYSGARCRSAGFSLVEVAIVLVIVGVMLASLSGPLSSWRDSDRYRETARYLETARAAVMTFARVNGYLPCPDTDNDGAENRDGSGECLAVTGWLPWLTLGLASESPWEAVPFYNVHHSADEDCTTKTETQCFFSTDGYDFSTDEAGRALSVEDENGDELIEKALLVIGSYGANSRATEANCATGTSSAEEAQNCTFDNRTYRYFSYRENFDDQLIWLDKLSILGLLVD